MVPSPPPPIPLSYSPTNHFPLRYPTSFVPNLLLLRFLFPPHSFAHVHVFGSTREYIPFHMDTDCSSMCAAERGETATDAESEDEVEGNEEERKERHARTNHSHGSQAGKESKKKWREEKGREEERADSHSTNMVDRLWMSGGAHGVTHAPHLAIRARASSLIK